MNAILIALMILLGIISTPEEAANLSQEEIQQIENTILETPIDQI